MENIKTRCLFLTASEYGQANVILAMASELVARDNVDVHIASFTPLQKRVEALQANVSKTSLLTFHVIDGLSFVSCLLLWVPVD